MLESVHRKISEFLDELDYKKAKEMTLEIPSGKMLRSKVVEAVAGVNEESVSLSAVIELIHLASLLHDDVIDRADSRRGIVSINKKFGDIYAVMLGDILYSKAFYELTSMPEFVSKTLSNAVNKLSIGELMDVDESKKFSNDKELYYKIIYLKTGVLIEAATKCGAFLAGKDSSKLGVFGKNIGIAFQVADDILDITSDSETLGKPAFSDFREGKSTLPFILLYERLDPASRDRLAALCGTSFDMTDEEWIRGELLKHDVIKRCKKEAFALVEEARSSAKDEEALLALASKLIDRKF